ncbi:copper-binding protein [Halopseudomonas bauzanensis]|nr:copper-binding protein [Halopseudomonas bauzanensis]
MSSLQFNVQQMTCNNCVKHVTEALMAVAGVTDVQVSLEDSKVTVAGSADSAALISALGAAGYPAAAVGAHAGHTTCCGGCS